MNEHGVCKLTDFGSCKKISGIVNEKFCSIKGTANWMAPEVIR